MYGATMAPVGQASMHRVHDPHVPLMGESGAMCAVVAIPARKKNDPRRGMMSIVFLPTKPTPHAAA